MACIAIWYSGLGCGGYGWDGMAYFNQNCVFST